MAGRRLNLFLFLSRLDSVPSGDRKSDDRDEDSLRFVNVVDVIGERKLFCRWTVRCFGWPVCDMVSLRASRDSLGYSMPCVCPSNALRTAVPDEPNPVSRNGKHLDRNGRTEIITRKNMKRVSPLRCTGVILGALCGLFWVDRCIFLFFLFFSCSARMIQLRLG